MKSTRTIQFHRRAVMALLSFPRGTRARIERQLENFAAGPAAVRPPDVRRIDEDEPVYLLRVTPSTRAIFQEQPDGFEVQDVVRTDILRSFAPRGPGSGHVLPRKRLRRRSGLLPSGPSAPATGPAREGQ